MVVLVSFFSVQIEINLTNWDFAFLLLSAWLLINSALCVSIYYFDNPPT